MAVKKEIIKDCEVKKEEKIVNPYCASVILNAWRNEKKEVAVITSVGVFIGTLVSFGRYEITLAALEEDIVGKPYIIQKGSIVSIMSRESYKQININKN